MPLIIGRVTNPDHMSPWELPQQQSLSGFRSKELYGQRNNHLILDDSSGQIQAQLQSDHQTSRLSLVHITRIVGTAGRADYRGQGAELRTDGWGAIRAKQGLYLTTYGSNAHITELKASTSQLKLAQQQQRNLNQLAIDHQADERSIEQTAQTALDQQNQHIAGHKTEEGTSDFPELQQPHLLIDSAAGIALATEHSLHLAGNQHIALTSAQDTDMTVGKRLSASVAKGISLFSQSLGIKAFAAKGKVKIQAQSDAVEVIADQVLKLISAKSKVEIAAHDEILLTAKGSYTKINGKGIEHGTPKSFTWYTPMLGMPGPKRIKYDLPKIKTGKYSNRLDVYSIFWRENFNDLKFKAYFKNGRVVEGRIDEHGRTERIFSSKQEEVTVLVGLSQGWAARMSHIVPNNSLRETETSQVSLYVVDALSKPVSGLKYKITDSECKVFSGVTDSEGKISPIQTRIKSTLDVAVEDEEHKMQSVCTFTLLGAAELTYRLDTHKLKQSITLKPEEGAGSYRRSTYEVKKGDSLKSIANQFGFTIFQIASLNQIFSDDDLREGVILKLPLEERKV